MCAVANKTVSKHALHTVVEQDLEYLACVKEAGIYGEEEMQRLLQEHQANTNHLPPHRPLNLKHML